MACYRSNSAISSHSIDVNEELSNAQACSSVEFTIQKPATVDLSKIVNSVDKRDEHTHDEGGFSEVTEKELLWGFEKDGETGECLENVDQNPAVLHPDECLKVTDNIDVLRMNDKEASESKDVKPEILSLEQSSSETQESLVQVFEENTDFDIVLENGAPTLKEERNTIDTLGLSTIAIDQWNETTIENEKEELCSKEEEVKNSSDAKNTVFKHIAGSETQMRGTSIIILDKGAFGEEANQNERKDATYNSHPKLAAFISKLPSHTEYRMRQSKGETRDIDHSELLNRETSSSTPTLLESRKEHSVSDEHERIFVVVGVDNTQPCVDETDDKRSGVVEQIIHTGEEKLI